MSKISEIKAYFTQSKLDYLDGIAPIGMGGSERGKSQVATINTPSLFITNLISTMENQKEGSIAYTAALNHIRNLGELCLAK